MIIEIEPSEKQLYDAFKMMKTIYDASDEQRDLLMVALQATIDGMKMQERLSEKKAI